jgi:uncharacterized protein YjbI with pentapeptide repeats
LWKADLRGANLRDARLHGANLSGALFNEQTILPDATHWSSRTEMARFIEDH